MKFFSFVPAFLWMLIIFFLLVMPGSDIPSNSLFDLIDFDKWVHTGLFCMLTLLWSYPFIKSNFATFKILIVAVLASLYGIGMEFVQKDYTTSRDFDIFDMIADTSGALIAAFFLIIVWQKIGPCGNRGRNQN